MFVVKVIVQVWHCLQLYGLVNITPLQSPVYEHSLTQRTLAALDDFADCELRTLLSGISSKMLVAYIASSQSCTCQGSFVEAKKLFAFSIYIYLNLRK